MAFDYEVKVIFLHSSMAHFTIEYANGDVVDKVFTSVESEHDAISTFYDYHQEYVRIGERIQFNFWDGSETWTKEVEVKG